MVSTHAQSSIGFPASGETGAEIVYYIVRKIKGKYYLIKIEFDPLTGKKKQTSLGNVEEIERIVNWFRVWYAPRVKPKAYGAGGGIRTHAGLRHRGLSPNHACSATREFQLDARATREKIVEKFVEWCVESGASRDTCEQYGRYLMKPYDENNKWSRLAYKKYFKWLGLKEEWEAIKVKSSNPDLRVPTEGEVRETITKACEASEELCLIYRLLVESGVRLKEVVKVLNDFDPAKLKEHGGFYTYELGYYRGSKRAFYLFSVTKPRRFKCSDKWVSNWAAKHDLVNPKYIRKFVSTKLAQLGVPAEIIDFIQGRTPRKILTQHYLNLYAIALQYYPKYAEWLRGWLRG